MADADHALIGVDLDAELLQLLLGRLGEPLGQIGKDAGCRLDQADLHIAGDVDAVEAVVGQMPQRLMHLRRELDAGGPGADDGDAQHLAGRPVRLELRPQADAEQALLEAVGLLVAVEIEAMLGDAGNGEIIARAAHGDDQRVIGDLPGGGYLLPIGVQDRRQMHLALRPVETVHAAGLEGEMMVAGMAQEIHVVVMRPHGADRHLMQQRLPDMGERIVDEGDLRPPAAAQPVAELGGQHQPAGAAADDNDVVGDDMVGSLGQRPSSDRVRCARVWPACPAKTTGSSVSAGDGPRWRGDPRAARRQFGHLDRGAGG